MLIYQPEFGKIIEDYVLFMKGGVLILLETTENKTKANALNGLSLAFLGDAVYELLVREYLIGNGSLQIGKLHKMAVTMVNAGAQAKFFDLLEPFLTEEELSAMHRGRNASSSHVPKGASAIEYRKATGIESLFGWLYLSGELERIRELFDKILDHIS